MQKHIYLRAYMAGIVVPTILLLVAATVFTIARYVYNVPVPIERVIVFPMAVVPNAWGLWNVLFVAWRSRLQLSLGLHGALLPFLLAPLGIVVVSLLNSPIPDFVKHAFPVAAPVGLLLSLEVSGRFSEPSCRTRLSLSEAGLSARTGFEMRKPAPFHDCFDLPRASTVYPRCSRPPGAASNFWTNFMEELCGRSSKRKPNHRP